MAYELTQIAPALWVGQSRTFALNSGVFLSNGQACLIDPGMYPDEIAASAAFVVAQDAAISSIVLTHIHWDHILGPQHFSGVPVLAQARLPQLAAQQGDEVIGEILQWAETEGVALAAPFVIPYPSQTFDMKMTLAVGDLRLRLAHAPGHSPDMLVLYEPDSGTLWAADILSDIEIPGVDNLAEYEQTLARLAGWDIRALIPGHGAPTTDRSEIAARLRDDTAYLVELRGRVAVALRDGMSLEETQAICADMIFRVPDEYNVSIQSLNVAQAYKELRTA